MEYTNLIGTNIARLRREKGAKQEELANFVGVSAQAVSKWENGGLPDTELLPKIADFFGVSVDALFGRNAGNSENLQKTLLGMIHSDDSEEALKEAYKICYLVNNAICHDEGSYYTDDLPNEFFTGFFGENGYSMFRTSRSLPFYLIAPYIDRQELLSEGTNYPALFADLADEDLFAALRYFLNRTSKADFTANLFTKQLGFSGEKAAAVIEKMKKYSLLHTSVVEMDDEEVEMYKFRFTQAFMFTSMLIFARSLPQPKNE